MSRGTRFLVFWIGAGLVFALFGLAFFGLPPFGTGHHPYRDAAVAAAAAHQTANVVSSVNFDQRGLDTLIEETILLGSVIGAAALLRLAKEETESRQPASGGRVLDATQLAGYLLLPVTLVIGIDVVVHGHLTPGGGFQGGVVLATGLHLLYLSGRYHILERLRPTHLYEFGEVLGALAFAGIGLAAIAVAGSFLANELPFGSFGKLLSGGNVPVLNIAVGLEVGASMVVLLAAFLDQVITVESAEAAEESP